MLHFLAIQTERKEKKAFTLKADRCTVIVALSFDADEMSINLESPKRRG